MSGNVPSRLATATVIVDQRNAWSSAKAMFGQGRRVSVAGVREALRHYGFDVLEMYLGIATTTPNKHPSPQVQKALKSNLAYASAISNEPGGQVMHGRLVERAKVVEEKLVDVLCATQIARAAHKIAEGTTAAEAIVVLSEDMDLIPAYKFAQELGVEIYAASHSTVDTRPDSKWLLLTEGAWRLACGRPDGRDYGHMLRRRIAKICMNANTTMAFKVRAFARSERRAFLSHASGAQAVWNSVPAGMSLPVGSRHNLHVVGLDLDNVERAFPLYTVANTPAPFGATIFPAHVLGWKTSRRVEVEVEPGDVRTLSAPAGSLLPGDQVAIHDYKVGTQVGCRLIGALNARPATPGWADPTLPVLCTVISSASSPGARVRAVLGPGQEITVQPPSADMPQLGDIYAAIPIAHTSVRQGTHVIAIAVSSNLRIV